MQNSRQEGKKHFFSLLHCTWCLRLVLGYINTCNMQATGCIILQPGCIPCASHPKDAPRVLKFYTKQPTPGKCYTKCLVDSKSYSGREILDIFGWQQFIRMVEVYKNLGNFMPELALYLCLTLLHAKDHDRAPVCWAIWKPTPKIFGINYVQCSLALKLLLLYVK